jgi:hypothetical protein
MLARRKLSVASGLLRAVTIGFGDFVAAGLDLDKDGAAAPDIHAILFTEQAKMFG